MFYDQGGFLQQIRVRAGRDIYLDGSVRLGGAGGKFEGAATLGVLYGIRF
jgi:hypothetical protein